MGHRYQKGSKRPDPRQHRDRGRRRTGWEPSPLAVITWPTFGDGTAWTEAVETVTHPEAPGEVGELVRVDWDGRAWVAVVHWPAKDRRTPAMEVRHPIGHLYPETPNP